MPRSTRLETPKGENALQDSQQRELMKQLDQLSEQIREREHEEARAKINELFQRVKMPGQNDMAHG
jgi:hypothetical protein